jgi:dipeptidyl aminopeptidase/acylaminoacyl peptidase
MAHLYRSFTKRWKYLFLQLLTLSLFAADKTFAQTPVANNEKELHQVIKQYVEQQGKVKWISQAVISPNGKYIAWAADGQLGNSTHAIYYAPVASPDKVVRITAAATNKWAYETEPQWSPDNKEIAFISDAQNSQNQVFVASIVSASVKPLALTKFDGYISHLKWSGDGRHLSVLYVEKASREPSPMAAENRRVGVVDSLVRRDIQRIAVINRVTKETTLATPADIYVFEYDWSPDVTRFAYTASVPPGDDNWYIAKLYKQSVAKQDAAVVYNPALQIALPKWSPDGKQIAFVEGIMSDQGGTGGEIFTVKADGSIKPIKLTTDRKSTPSWYTWRPDGNILFTEFVGGATAIATLNITSRKTETVWKGDETVQATAEATSVSVASQKGSPVLALIRTSFSMLPEVWGGTINKLKQITHINSEADLALPKAQNIEWINENQRVQGWLLFPADYDAAKHYPMLVAVHGGPAWISTPTWSAPDFNTTLYTRLGYFVFFPNPRGSHGQGEKFTQANRRDWGFGDLRDITSGVDTLFSRFPIDKSRVGMLGWSYGGFMSMFAGTQTSRFKAVVAGAGASDWLSYYGQNSIDKWMMSYFGASPYDDPAAYAKSSAMTYIKQTKTPALILVGERDGEAPAPQSFQYWHALKELNVPTQLVVYPDEGHSFYKSENLIDVTFRTIKWFNKYMPVK